MKYSRPTAVFILLFLIGAVLFVGWPNQSELQARNLKMVKLTKKHQIVFQLSSEDTLVQKSVFRQIKNILSLSPESQIEVVCHGPGLFLLVKDKTLYHKEIESLREMGVVFAACEFAMKNYKISKDQLVPGAVPVPSGLLEIIEKQEAGWSYIKAGF